LRSLLLRYAQPRGLGRVHALLRRLIPSVAYAGEGRARRRLSTHLLDLIVSTQEVHYERFRDQKLQEGGLSDGKTPEQLRRDLNAEFDRKTAALKKQYEEKQAQATEKIKANEAAFRAEEVKMYAEKEKLINEVNELKKAVNALLAAAPAPKKK